jgi:uncharacterized membrane protein YdbT with pleckstrin-like domain
VGEAVSRQSDQPVKIKPSLIPFTWKGLLVVFLGLVFYFAIPLFRSLSPAPFSTLGSFLTYAFLGLLGLGFFMILIGAVRRNTYTYQLTLSDLVIQKQLLRRSLRRIPFSSISDVEVSQSLAGRLAGYGNIVPITKSGYGLVRGMEQTENLVAEMTNVPDPDKVANLILSRTSQAHRLAVDSSH